jgi:hypothetical protein
MCSEPSRDPRFGPLRPTAEEAESWASREHKRREAWLAGPTQEEQDEWARRARLRAAVPFGESRLGPSPEEVAAWADRERKRRQAWLAGPTEGEQRDWARRQRPAFAMSPESDLGPTHEEMAAWADHERRRRQAWLDGPTEEEKDRWIRRESGELWSMPAALGAAESELVDSLGRLLREADLATKGSVNTLARMPFAIWSYLVRSGRALEDELYQPAPRRRVRF